MSEEDIQEYVDRLKECKEYDAESGHMEADKVLIDFIFYVKNTRDFSHGMN